VIQSKNGAMFLLSEDGRSVSHFDNKGWKTWVVGSVVTSVWFSAQFQRSVSEHMEFKCIKILTIPLVCRHSKSKFSNSTANKQHKLNSNMKIYCPYCTLAENYFHQAGSSIPTSAQSIGSHKPSRQGKNNLWCE
jgi:hypothetical protein